MPDSPLVGSVRASKNVSESIYKMQIINSYEWHLKTSVHQQIISYMASKNEIAYCSSSDESDR